MYLPAHVAAFGGESASFVDYGRRVRLWNQSAEADPAKRAAMLILQMDSIARRACLNAADDTFTQGEDV